MIYEPTCDLAGPCPLGLIPADDLPTCLLCSEDAWQEATDGWVTCQQ